MGFQGCSSPLLVLQWISRDREKKRGQGVDGSLSLHFFLTDIQVPTSRFSPGYDVDTFPHPLLFKRSNGIFL